jgi:DNA ligase-1
MTTMLKPFKPLLAEDFIEAELRFPGLLSVKLDGIRAINHNGVLMSRNMKPIPNPHVREKFKDCLHLDGELIYGDPTSPTCYRDTNSVVMSKSGKSADNVRFYVFDHIGYMDEPYYARLAEAARSTLNLGHPDVVLVDQKEIESLAEMEALEGAWLEQGYEGAMFRCPHAPYKQGRSTVKEGIILKVKRFADAEAIIIGFEEQNENTNEKTVNELGHSQRSSHKAGMVGKGTLGKFIVRDIKTGVEFSCGTGVGLTIELRQQIWNEREAYLGKIITYKHFPIGVKDKPRFPIWKGFRSADDMAV